MAELKPDPTPVDAPAHTMMLTWDEILTPFEWSGNPCAAEWEPVIQLPCPSGAAVPESGKVITGLADLQPGAIVQESYLAGMFSVTARTIRRMVVRAQLPPPIYLGKRPVWLAGRLLAFLNLAAEQAEQEAEQEAEKRARKAQPLRGAW